MKKSRMEKVKWIVKHVKLHLVGMGQAKLGYVRVGWARLRNIILGQLTLGWVELGQVWLAQARLGQVMDENLDQKFQLIGKTVDG